MSLSSQTIKDICNLHTSKGRKATNLFIAEGTRTVFTFIEHNWRPIHIYLTEDKQEFLTTLDKAVPCTVIPARNMESISPSTTPSGFLAIFKMPPNPPAEKLAAGLVLASVADPGNMGTLIRSCAAFGYQSVVVVEGCDPYSPKVVQASAGTLATVKLFRWSWGELVRNKGEFSLCALVCNGGSQPQDLSFEKTLIVVGNEAHGIPAAWLASCEQQMTLPMNGNVESLNAAVAGSLALYVGSLQK